MHGPFLGAVQETLLIPLYGRAVEHRKRDAALRDGRAAEIVAGLSYDFGRFDGLPSLVGTVLRTVLFDSWVRDFLATHPSCTIVEIGTGLNTRYERVDNGRARWFELDLPDVIEVRRSFFSDTPRRTMIAASVTDSAWAEAVAAGSDGPYFFSAEAVLPFLDETDVRAVVGMIAARFPGSRLALDTAGPAFISGQNGYDALSKVAARMRWSCAGPDDLTRWRSGIELVASHTLSALPSHVYGPLPAPYQEMLAALAEQRPPQVEEYRLNLFQLP
ncbi:class I SAM-dependent methyltransferase [Streptomyces sp. NPDC057486]|uniref:class I SAM-dependent methyltransferase n=1 Tax=Streptomyces sp. NPDC057486 TaxID=3346145 RepID=UPI0036CFE59C